MLYKLIKFINKIWTRYRSARLNFMYIGNNVTILEGFQISYENNCIIHDNVRIGINSYLYCIGGLEIGSGTITGPNLTIYTANHIYNDYSALPYSNNIKKQKVTIGCNCWIGTNVIILPGINIGEGSVVAAGSVVTKSFPDCVVIGGNPAKIIKYKDIDLYMKLKKRNILCDDLSK